MATSLSTAGPHLTHDSFGPSEPTTQTASRSVRPFLHRWQQSVPILYNGAPFSPQNYPLHMEWSGPRSNTWFLWPTRVPNLRHLDRCSRFYRAHYSLVWQTDRQTDRQTTPLSR